MAFTLWAAQVGDSHQSSSSSIPSSSTAIVAQRWKYDVFLSFRGPDTCKGITVDIHDRVQSRGIRTFMDDHDLQAGDMISPSLVEAIERSRFAVIVLSRNSVSSTWCLEELVKICECMADEKRIFPVFYHVDPTEVRYQKKGSFEEAFSKHETSGRHQPEMVTKWRAALNKVSHITGLSTNDFKTHRELVDSIVESLMVTPDAIEFTSDFHTYEATMKVMDEVNEALRDEEITMVGVCGMGGVGKKTMVRHVAAQACRNGTFKRWIIVTISQKPDFRKIQDTLAEFLGFKIKGETEDGRATRLHVEIRRRENLLLILYDVWDIIELSKVGIPSFKELQNSNSKILLTRRSIVCHVMECQKKITFNCLSEHDSWTLFTSKASRSFDSPTLKDVAKRVVQECGGLPIALITVARTLGDKDLHEWKRAAKRLEKSQYANPDHKYHVIKCIRLSYDYLKDEECKSFFLCCLFPEDYHIPIDYLFKYAIGKGMFTCDGTLEEARDRAKNMVTYLK